MKMSVQGHFIVGSSDPKGMLSKVSQQLQEMNQKLDFLDAAKKHLEVCTLAKQYSSLNYNHHMVVHLEFSSYSFLLYLGTVCRTVGIRSQLPVRNCKVPRRHSNVVGTFRESIVTISDCSIKGR